MPPDIELGIFVNGEVKQDVHLAIRTTKFLIGLGQRFGIIGNIPAVPIRIATKAQNHVEAQLTLVHGPILDIQSSINRAMRRVLVFIQLSFLAGGITGGIIGYSCSQSKHSSNQIHSQPQAK